MGCSGQRFGALSAEERAQRASQGRSGAAEGATRGDRGVRLTITGVIDSIQRGLRGLPLESQTPPIRSGFPNLGSPIY